MRAALIIAGILFLIAGIWVVAGNASYSDTKTDAQIGSLKIQHTESKAIPEWAGIAGIVVGGLLLVGGIANKQR